MTEKWPRVSVIMPTLNCDSILKECLGYVRAQDYPQDKIEIVIADANSTDDTVKVAKSFGARVFKNPLLTSEAGKAVAIKEAKGEYYLFIDSDNFIEETDWLKRILEPMLANKEVVGSEPLWYTYRRQDPLISRYTAMMGLVDPAVFFTGNYDRRCLLSNTWTKLPIPYQDKPKWLELTLSKGKVPTLGSNGSLLRASIFNLEEVGEYLFDNDNISELAEKKPIKFAKVKIGIVHKFSATVRTFARKQRRRIKDFLYYSKVGMRTYQSNVSNRGLYIFIIYSILIFPVILQSIIGFIKKPDVAWFVHPLLCWITLWVYGSEVILARVRGVEIESRQGWQQTK